MGKYIIVLLSILTLRACADDVKMDFSEESIEISKGSEIAINIPRAEGKSDGSKVINETLINFVISQCNLSEESLKGLSLEEALEQFNNDFENFKSNFPDSSQRWEFFVDGEITYQSENIISIGLTTYIDTGGAHGNTNVKFFNFNPDSGAQYSTEEIIENLESFEELVESLLLKKLQNKVDKEPAENFFFGEDFKLPESLGLSDEGIIVLYNPYEVASYSQGIIEFTIPFEDVEDYLLIY